MILGACSAGPGVTTLPTNSHAPTALATLTATISAAPSAAAGPIGEGTYQSQAVPIATIIAKINADTELTDSEKASAAAGFSGHQTQVVELNFHSGQLTQSSAFDGAPFEVGDRFTYASPDDHTLVVQETCCGSISTFDLAPGANSFTLKYRTGVPNAEDIIGQTIFELSPFTLVP
jgi:hypothetical protein